MGIFAQKQNQAKSQTSFNFMRSNTAIATSSDKSSLRLTSQYPTGNQAVTAAPYFVHDFSQISIYPSATGAIQTKLTLNQPCDQYEQEADRLSEQTMRSSGYQTEQPNLEQDRLRTKRVGSNDLGQSAAPPILHEVLRTSGQPLDPATRGWMEARFGHDFQQVRVHHDGKAAESAKAIQALAYTKGNHIAFANGQYSPTTESGKRLLAHELVHTMQQGNNILYRKIDFTEPTPILADPIPLAINGTILGSTIPGLNGTILPKTAIKKAYKEAVFNALQPQTFNFSATKTGMTGKVDPAKFNINVSAEVRAITEPDKDKWSASYPVSMLNNPPSVCADKGANRIPIEMEGKPDSSALYKKVLAHEQEHVSDLKSLSNTELKPYHDFLVGLTGTGKTEKECVDDIFKQVGNKDALAAQEFVEKWLVAVQVYDKVGGTHHSKFVTKVDANCAKIQITEKV